MSLQFEIKDFNLTNFDHFICLLLGVMRMYFDVFWSTLKHVPLLKRGQNTKVMLALDSVTQFSDFLIVLKVNFVPDIACTSDPME